MYTESKKISSKIESHTTQQHSNSKITNMNIRAIEIKGQAQRATSCDLIPHKDQRGYRKQYRYKNNNKNNYFSNKYR